MRASVLAARWQRLAYPCCLIGFFLGTVRRFSDGLIRDSFAPHIIAEGQRMERLMMGLPLYPNQSTGTQEQAASATGALVSLSTSQSSNSKEDPLALAAALGPSSNSALRSEAHSESTAGALNLSSDHDRRCVVV
jgi:hypothetical protein